MKIKFKLNYMSLVETYQIQELKQRPTFKVYRLGIENKFKVRLYVTCVKLSSSRTENQDQLSRYWD